MKAQRNIRERRFLPYNALGLNRIEAKWTDIPIPQNINLTVVAISHPIHTPSLFTKFSSKLTLLAATVTVTPLSVSMQIKFLWISVSTKGDVKQMVRRSP